MSPPEVITDSPADAPAGSTWHVLSLSLTILLGLAISLGAFWLVRHAEHERVRRSFDAQAQKLGEELAVALARYQETLYTLRDVFAASEYVSYREFRTAAADLRERHPGIQTLEWLRRIPHAERAATETRAREEIFANFAIKEGDSDDDLRLAGERAEYLAALYVEPLAGHEPSLGLDHFIGPHQRAIMRARDTGEMVATRRVSLPGDGPGWLLFLPIYGPGPMPKMVEERQAKFLGCLKGSFRLSDLITTTIDDDERKAMDVLLVDHTPASTEPFLIQYSGDTMRLAPPPTEADFRAGEHQAIALPVAGRDWFVLFRPTPRWLAAQATGYSYAFLGSGLLLTGLLASALRGVQQRASQVREMVTQRTAELHATQVALREDIRQRAVVESALRASEERYRAFIVNSTEATCRYEFEPPVKIDQPEADIIEQLYRHARMAECNDALARSYGYQSAPEMIGRRLSEIMPADLPANVRHMETLVRNGFRLEDQESVELDRHGHKRIFLNNVTGIVLGGELHRLWSTQRDVTEQRAVENARRENETRLRLAVAAADLGTWEWNAATGQMILSDGTERILGLAPGTFDGSTAAAAVLIHPDDLERISVAATLALTEGTEYHAEHRIVRPNGAVRWIVARGAVIENDTEQRTRLIGAVMDVTEEHERADEKAHMEKKLQETQKLESLGILAGGIAHDFNNLLTGILGNASLARMDLPPGSPAHPSLEAIETVSLRAAELCKQMLAYSGKGRFLVHRLDLSALVQETAELIQVSIGKKVVLKFALSEILPAIAADATQLRQIIMNLVINASEAIGDQRGQVTLSTGIVQADHAYLAHTHLSPDLPAGEYVYLEVSDNGGGMDAETQARIFDPFFTTKFTGRGLGLAAVLGIVRGHGGALRVYSEPGKGSTFKLLLPAVTGSPDTIAPSGGVAPAWRMAGTVLVVDDEEAVRNVSSRILQSWGCQTELACDGREAVAKFRDHPDRFVAVLLDLTMPEMDGTATFTELRRIRPGVSVLLMSGFNEQDAVSRFAGKGLAGFLQKPFQPEALQAKLRLMLEGTPPA